jgi:hypothetical protein
MMKLLLIRSQLREKRAAPIFNENIGCAEATMNRCIQVPATSRWNV